MKSQLADAERAAELGVARGIIVRHWLIAPSTPDHELPNALVKDDLKLVLPTFGRTERVPGAAPVEQRMTRAALHLRRGPTMYGVLAGA
jgi:hypothetical protein